MVFIPLLRDSGHFFRKESNDPERSRRALIEVSLKNRYPLSAFAGLVQWQYTSFPSLRRGFDSRIPLHYFRSFFGFGAGSASAVI